MSLSWKDAVATVLVGTAGVITYARLKGLDWPFLTSWRTGTLALLILGLGTCIVVGSGVVPTNDGWTTTATLLGVVAFLFALGGMVLDSKWLFLALAADNILLWTISTVHHFIMSGV